MRIWLATANAKKGKELLAILGPIVELETLEGRDDLTLPEETGDSFEANAALKAEHLCRQVAAPVLADDSGLEVVALAGQPGVHSARYAPGTDRDRVEKLLGELAGVTDRRARFVSAIALARPGLPTVVVRGTIEGEITAAPTGTGGFGYDPVFFIPGEACTMAELPAARKNQISHRAAALRRILPELETSRRQHRA